MKDDRPRKVGAEKCGTAILNMKKNVVGNTTKSVFAFFESKNNITKMIIEMGKPIFEKDNPTPGTRR
jgi:hypothetical protein